MTPAPDEQRADEPPYVPNWVIPEAPPMPTYAEKLAAYQADQELRFTSSNRAEYERRKAVLQEESRRVRGL